MERRIVKKCEGHIQEFKTNIKDWLDNSEFSKNTQYSDFLKYLFDYEGISLEKEDFQKRKRVKNMVPHFDRCIANRANGEQCTRRKQNNYDYCGTHIKGTPHGKILVDNNDIKPVVSKIEVFVQEIKGINYYIDKNGNVYLTEDIVNNSKNPSIIAKYEKKTNGDYYIPSLGLN
jgi:hypothetical protein